MKNMGAHVTAVLLILASLTACWRSPTPEATSGGASTKSTVSTPEKPGKLHALAITGFNYTDQYIDQLYVDGQGGGNVRVSSPSSGGGGGVCCIGWRDGTPLPQRVTVRWASDGCQRSTVDSTGYKDIKLEHFFTEKVVELNGPIPAEPGNFEVHIYPDQHVEVAITQYTSDPRVKLAKARQIDPYKKRCRDEKDGDKQ